LMRSHEVFALQCPCGYAILCDVRCFRERLGTLAFLDNEQTSQTYGKRVRSCPGCGEQLEVVRLFSKGMGR
jgi:hypothetical protein